MGEASVEAPVLFISAWGERGGIQVVLHDLIHELRRTGGSTAVLSLAEGPFADELRSVGGPFECVPCRVRDRTQWARAAAAGARMVRDLGCVLLHVDDAKAHLLGHEVSRRASIPLVRWLHAWHPRPFSRDRWLAWLAVRRGADAWAANSLATARRFRRWLPSQADVCIVAPGVDPCLRRGSAEPGRLRQTIGVGGDGFLIVSAGRLVPGKGWHVIVEALSLLQAAGVDCHAAFAGGQAQRGYVERLYRAAAASGVGSRVHWVGFCRDVVDWMATADVVVHAATEPEGFGLVLVEAMSQSRPVVATRTGGPEEIICHAVDGLLVSPGKPAELAECLRTLHASPTLRRRLGEAAYRTFRSRYTLGRMANDLRDLYAQVREALPSSPHPPPPRAAASARS